MRPKIKGENCAVFCFAGKRIFYLFMIDYFTKKEKKLHKSLSLLWSATKKNKVQSLA